MSGHDVCNPAFWQAGNNDDAFRQRFWRKTRRVVASVLRGVICSPPTTAPSTRSPLPVKMSLIGALAGFIRRSTRFRRAAGSVY